MPRRPIYDWELWTDGNEHTIYMWHDFKIIPSSMVAQLHLKAKKLGMKVETAIETKAGTWDGHTTSKAPEISITFRFFKPPTREQLTQAEATAQRAQG